MLGCKIVFPTSLDCRRLHLLCPWEGKALDLVVVSSSPTVGAFVFFLHPWLLRWSVVVDCMKQNESSSWFRLMCLGLAYHVFRGLPCCIQASLWVWLFCNQWAQGAVVSHPLCLREALCSIPSGSALLFRTCVAGLCCRGRPAVSSPRSSRRGQ